MLPTRCLGGLAGGLETKVINAAARSEPGAPPQRRGGGGEGLEIEVVNADGCGVDEVLLAVVSAIAPCL